MNEPGDDLDGEGLDHDGDVDGPGSNTPAPEREHFPRSGTDEQELGGDRTPTMADRRDMLFTVAKAHGDKAADWLTQQLDGDANARAIRELGTAIREGDSDITTAVREGDSSITTAVREGDSAIVTAVNTGDREIIEAIGNQGRLMIWSNLVALAIVAALAGVTSAMDFGGWGFTAGPKTVEASKKEEKPEHNHELWHDDEGADVGPDVGPGLDTGTDTE